ncbi:hypothetical protein I8G32_04232 [Rhodopseudomonas palustris]|uniref:Uncharacterized protein n=2 Tax=Rhodopseudomonas palustris TaxID=1076 RepID=Q6N2F0_RHOPA|nr:hypothetical protein [Rhodopseudomonas palustris]OPF92494.1 hypothetical protein B1S06_15125 [Rhodopseudomonas palustris]QQM05662.1 hypothetical protein I8G32_04232 [Rhodopseudomonas palustris]RJF63890.1 hypothetical protein D4Q71_12335 [Rhodopseudomonas palustris]WAB76991.1 hypothetical protein OR798_21240 [Rhodopseudomonas palustris]WCL94286.1 hypothetical protein TX73_021235 [Rhodopseudomonas palustris CGA009]
MNTTKAFIFTSRLFGILALCVGIAYWLGYDVPLELHMGLGVLLVIAVWGLAVLAREQATQLALIAALWAAIVPVLGLLQVHLPLGETSWLLRVLHVVAGVGAIGLAEALNKRIKRIAITG